MKAMLLLIAFAIASGHAPEACEDEFAMDHQEFLQHSVSSLSLSQSPTKRIHPDTRSTSHSQQVWMQISIVATVLLAGAVVATITSKFDASLPWLSFLLPFTYSTFYGCQISLSYDIAVKHGGNAASSGILLAGPVLSNFVGSALGQLMGRRYCTLYRSLMIIATLLLGLNLIAFWGMAASSFTSMSMLMLVRLVEGILVGIVYYWRMQLMEDEEASESEVEASMLWNGIGMAFGLGVGPIMTALGERLFYVFDSDRNSVMAAATGYFPLFLILPCCSACWTLKVVGKSSDDEKGSKVENAADTPPEVSDMASGSTAVRVTALAIGLLLLTLWQFALQSIEVGTAFLLEVVYDMDTKNIGLLIGASFFVILPLAGIVGTFLEALDSDSQLKALIMVTMVNVLACFLFLPVNLQGARCWLLILLGDTIVFSTTASVGGILNKHLLFLSKGMLSWGAFSIFQQIAFSLRSLAGPLMRALIVNSAHHQLVYASSQIILAVCVVVSNLVFLSLLRSMGSD